MSKATDIKSDPTPVKIVDTAHPLPVAIIAGQTPPAEDAIPPTTTAEENRSTYGQRTINLMWEGTQRSITLMVTSVALLVAAYLSISSSAPIELRIAAFSLLSYVCIGIQSSYYTRTNHTKTGGVGPNTVGR